MPTKSVPTPYPTFLTKDLLLDPENPRIVEFGLGEKPTQFDIMKTLWERMAVNEVATSIAWNGYFLHEPLFIEQDGKGQLIVIEGNRRLTAVKLLLMPTCEKGSEQPICRTSTRSTRTDERN